MKFLFVHNNFPAQFQNLVEELAGDLASSVAAIGSETSRAMPRVDLERYRMPAFDLSATHSFARRFDLECRRAEQVLFAASSLASSGFAPDVIVVHCGWGESLPLRAIFPSSKIIVYCEFYYRAYGQDVHFESAAPTLGADGVAGLECKNASTLLALADSDAGLSPTFWQRSTYPKEFHNKIEVVHEGVDTTRIRPNRAARFTLPGGRTLTRDDEVITFVSRNLEPMRGYHIFLRSLAKIQRLRPKAQIVIAGGDGVSYGPAAPDGSSWKTLFLEETLGALDFARITFLEFLPYDSYLKLLQVSSAHVYLTYPVVLSWSCVEAMAAGCILIGSDTPPVREVIEHGRNGVLVDFHDHEALADAVVEVLSKPEAYAHMGAAARETAIAHFDKRACVARAAEFVRSIGLAQTPGISQNEELAVA